MPITGPRSAGPVAAALPRVLPRSTAFWVVAGMLALLLFARGRALAEYAVYAARWQFSDTTLTAVFAVYAIALLAALLVVGSLSDHLGRRPVIIAALLIDSAPLSPPSC